MRIIRDYFDGEDEEDLDVMPDMDHNSHQFTFGMDEAAACTSADGVGESLQFRF